MAITGGTAWQAAQLPLVDQGVEEVSVNIAAQVNDNRTFMKNVQMATNEVAQDPEKLTKRAADMRNQVFRTPSPITGTMAEKAAVYAFRTLAKNSWAAETLGLSVAPEETSENVDETSE